MSRVCGDLIEGLSHEKSEGKCFHQQTFAAIKLDVERGHLDRHIGFLTGAAVLLGFYDGRRINDCASVCLRRGDLMMTSYLQSERNRVIARASAGMSAKTAAITRPGSNTMSAAAFRLCCWLAQVVVRFPRDAVLPHLVEKRSRRDIENSSSILPVPMYQLEGANDRLPLGLLFQSSN